jgi:hypothetical protein
VAAHLIVVTALLCECVRLILPDFDQLPQVAVNQRAPRARTAAVALEGRNQAHMRKAQLGLAALLCDLKDNVSADPLGLVFDKGQFGVSNMPHYIFCRERIPSLSAWSCACPCSGK